ncbi:ribbon-helix-helix domain-containing protein [Clostridium tarantellae]|uniref:Ribbon-helix-helix protein, CopG family n=1 Tax=Clostridium tarantellae TaxID=39493 RepID=A0A6I1MRC3_9CLOT|nr:ribbon-helix-helix domain-containing protein [Clostridium tarantellae]MPQ44762.1 hypothetical protein [Clostridium tarantellae]
MDKERIHFRIDKTLIDYVDKIKKKNNYTNRSQALEFIIKEHEKNLNLNMETMIDLIGDRVSKNIKENMLTLKKSNNHTDRNVQVLLEMMNGFYIKENFPNIFTLDEEEHVGYTTARKAVDNRIEKQRLLKLEKNFK